MRQQEAATRYRRTPTKDETLPAVEHDLREPTHGVRLSLVQGDLARLAAKLPPGTLEATQARIGEVGEEWLAHALRVMRGDGNAEG